MLDFPQAAELRRRLLFQGVSHKYVRKSIQELSDHWEDLREEAISSGLPEDEAGGEASRKLGSAQVLAEAMSIKMSRSSWWGRHKLLSFGIGPIIGIILWWAGMLTVLGTVSGAFWYDSSHPAASRPNWGLVQIWMEVTRYGGYIAVPWLIWEIACRAYCGWKCALGGCLIVAVHNFFQNAEIQTPSAVVPTVTFTWGYHYHSNWSQWNHLAFVVPLMMFSIFYLNNIRKGEAV